MERRKILYLEGRPHAHLLHRRLAMSLGCDIDYIDAKSRWQDLDKSFFSNVISWLKNAAFFAKKYHGYELFLIDNLHFTPVIMNMFFFSGKKKLIVHMGSHTLFFMHTKRFSKINLWMHKKILAKYSALICEGHMAEQFAHDLLKAKTPPTYVTFLGPPTERLPALKAIKPALESSTIIVIANCSSSFRLYYKGVDVMVRSFEIALNEFPNLEMKILGAWPAHIVDQLLRSVNKYASMRITFLGHSDVIEEHMAKASLCLHCTRGDAFPTSTLEALTAGIPTIVSTWTGTKEVVEQIDPSLIVAMDEKSIADRIIQYFRTPASEREVVSAKCREVAKSYTEELAVKHYQKIFSKICGDLTIAQVDV